VTVGFGTSGSLLLVFTGLFIAVGSFYTVAANTAERAAEATDRQRERLADVQESAINVTGATYDASGEGNLTVRVENTGGTTLSVGAVDFVVDGRYVPPGDLGRVTVAGNGTGVWRPGEVLVLEGSLSEAPDRVKVVTGPGVAEAIPVEVSG
jgi:flagellar protein FlaF